MDVEKQKFWDMRFAQLAKLVSLWSKDPSTKVGSVIVRPDKTIASVGFNGFPKGVPDTPEWYEDREIKYKLVKHAEENAILFSQESLEGYTLYVYPLPPCSQCAGDIVQRGIKRVVAVVPPAQMPRTNDPNFAFHLTRMMFDNAGVDFVVLEDDINLCDLEPR
ncbi:dCMP deaminase [Stenotrophomonas phage vB_SmaS-DLP_6]|nr:dCMP deaminase [Stenotrophomonas phage vB_SmaS-DLP_6]